MSDVSPTADFGYVIETCSQVIGHSPEDKGVPGPICLEPNLCNEMAWCLRDGPLSAEHPNVINLAELRERFGLPPNGRSEP